MKRRLNYYFLAVSLLLLTSGLLFLATLSAPISLHTFGNTTYYIFHQLLAAGIGLVLGLVALKLPLSLVKKITPILFIINFALLFAVFLPLVGTNFWGASRWISIGKSTVQPSEFLKITSILFLSSLIANRISDGKGNGFKIVFKKTYQIFKQLFLPFFILLSFISLVLYLQKDLSTLGIIAVSLIVIYFAARTPLWHTILLFVAGALGAGVFTVLEPYRVQRFLTFLNPGADPLGKGLQIKQSFIAMGSGGIFGKGWGMSTQKFGYLPQAMSDSVFAVLGEETGMIGTTILITLFLLFLYFGYQIAKHSNNKFAKFTAIGISTWIIFQTFINIASTTALFPLSGIPLPFFSYGGSHLIAEMIAVGLMLNISKNG